jgi:hypothetical protein
VSSVEKQIRDRVEVFVKDLETLIRQAAIEAVAAALGVKPSGAAAKLALPREARSGRGPAKAARRAPSAKRHRRTAKDLEALGQTIHDFVSRNPGARAEQIKLALKLDDADWALPVKKLVDDGRLGTKGEKRATTYFVKSGARSNDA